mmetsp:Transcript_60648/g.144536  ORF Transcript_60648/g.144536 Transcript_60648/m.144536 type:complete len:333 (-) Transcript_60648:165-1163(-)
MQYRKVVMPPAAPVTVSRWRKRDDAPIGSKATDRKVPAHRPQTKTERVLAALHDEILTGMWTGAKGETYELSCINSAHANSGTWSCVRTGADGQVKKFTIWYDEESESVWWGSWTYYFDPEETQRTGVIHWRKDGPGKGFEWHRAEDYEEYWPEENWAEEEWHEEENKDDVWPDEPPTIHVQRAEPEEEPEAVTVRKETKVASVQASEIKGYYLPHFDHVECVMAEFKFQPPPGLEKPEELQFFTEIPGKDGKAAQEAADIDTSAGPTPRESETEQSEQEQQERQTHSKGKSRTYNRAPGKWRPKEASKEADTEIRAPGAMHGQGWHPQLRW